MKKTFITLALAACAMMLVSCGNNGNKQNEAKQAEPAAAAKAAAADVKALTLGDVNDQNYAALIKDRCGFDPAPGDGMTLDKASASPGNATLKFKGAKGIEERDLQKLYFDRCKAVADGGVIYKLETNAEQGIHKGDPINSFDELTGFQWIYDYKGETVNCAVSKYGGMASLDTFEVRFGR